MGEKEGGSLQLHPGCQIPGELRPRWGGKAFRSGGGVFGMLSVVLDMSVARERRPSPHP